MPTNNNLWKPSLHKYIFNSVNSVITFVIVIAWQTLKNNIPLSIFALFQEDLYVVIWSLSIHTSNLQNSSRITRPDVFRFRRGTTITGPNFTIPGYQLRIYIFSAASQPLSKELFNLLPNSFILLHPGFISANVKPHLPRRTLVIPGNSRREATFRTCTVAQPCLAQPHSQ